MNEMSSTSKPLVYSCSGCSTAAQMANFIAVKLDRRGYAEMSCIAGVGGNVKKLVKLAKSGRKLITIDGCPLACSKACLQNHQLSPDVHFELTSFGITKTQHEDFDEEHARSIQDQIEHVIRMKYPVEEQDITNNAELQQHRDTIV